MSGSFHHRFVVAGMLTACAVLLRPIDVQAQHASTNIDLTAQSEWIEEAVSYMRTVQPGEEFRLIDIYDLKRFEKDQLSCKISSQAYVKLSDDQWIFFFLSSAHSNPEVGDVMLAITQDGDVYKSDAHVCGGASTFRSDDLIMPTTSKEFLEKFHSRDKSRDPWVKLEID